MDLAWLPGLPGKLSEDLAKARRQLEECRADNVTLFEKVRRPGQCGPTSDHGSIKVLLTVRAKRTLMSKTVDSVLVGQTCRSDKC